MHIKSFRQKDRYGNEMSVEFFDVPEMQIPVYDHPGDPKGTDTVPAWLTPGEYVINAEATRKYEPLLEEINEEGKEMQAAQGGSIPSYVFSGGMINNLSSLYRAEGGSTPSWLTDELLDSIMQVESGGDVEAKSSAGALGPYQIMPATAAQPGYGVTPLSQEELTDPVKSREFARSYLAGIAANNPDYTMEEVLQAYNAGPGRIARFKAGEGDPLTQETVEYPIKVMANLQTEKEPGIVDSILSMLNPVSTAEAQTIAPPVTQEAPPKEADPNAEFNRKIVQKNASGVFDSFKEMELKRQANLDAGRDEFEGINKYTYDGLKDAVEFQKEKLKDATERSLVANEVDRPLAEAALNKLDSDVAELTVPQPEDIAIQQSEGYQDAIRRAQVAGVKPPTTSEWKTMHTEDETGVAPIEREAGTVEAGDDTTVGKNIQEVAEITGTERPSKEVITGDDAQDTVINQVANSAKGEDDPDSKAIPPKKVKDEGENTDPATMDKIFEFFKGAFSDVFDGRELARMAIMYAGSRALGYSHGGSLNYSMKNYIKRVDASVAAREKFINSAEAIKRFTPASLAEYRKTGDRSKLKSLAPDMKKTGSNVYVRGIGKVQTFEDQDGVQYVEYAGKTVPIDKLKGIVEPWDEDVHGDKAVVNKFSSFAKEEIDVVNSELNLSDDKSLKINSEAIGNQANEFMRKIMRRNGVSINEAQPFYNSINGAIGDYLRAKAEAKKNGTKMPMSLEAYIEVRTFQPLTGVSQSAITGTSAENIRFLNGLVKREMESKDPKTKGFNTEYKADWAATYAAWNALPTETRADWIKKAENRNGWSGFTYWMSKTPTEEIVKILNQQ
jgi:hypothetical protein